MELFRKSAYDVISANYAIIGPGRHKLAQKVINKYKDSSKPLDLLGVAYAYMWEGASYRKLSIEYFEKYIESGFRLNTEHTSINTWTIYSDMATLYEKEYEFDKAIICLQKCIKIDGKTNPSDYTRIGDIYVKISVDKAEEYYLSLLNNPRLFMHKRAFAYSFDDVLEKKRRGYVYRPRKKK
ncbi:hypothetical protein Osc1_05340 [Hominimerdicola sp. 21CYCFAH17_S]